MRALVRTIALGTWALAGPANHAADTSPGPSASGEALARQYCAACHLFPAPELLDRRTWATTTLRRMAPMLGAARLNLDTRPDGEFLREAALFPEHPLLPEADWRAIGEYYLRNAPETAPPQAPSTAIAPTTPLFRAEAISVANVEPAITLVRIEPSENPVPARWRRRDGASSGPDPATREPRRLFLGDARRRALHVLSGRLELLSSTPVASPPVGLTRAGDHFLLGLIGDLFPSDLRSGGIVELRRTSEGFATRPVLAGLRRPVDCDLADIDGDGSDDLVVAEFGNYLGGLTAFRRRGDGYLAPDGLIDFPGAIRTEVVDLGGDGLPDLVTLFGQAREGVYRLRNRGRGAFEWVPWLHFPPSYGCTGFEIVDFDGNAYPDLLLTNGDNGDYPSPFKNYHGIRLFLGDGPDRFSQAWFHPMNGAFKAVARDFDGDGDLDVAAISFFP
ncbi:MAG: VCBS repeat-containing protein, partial [Verrucomicrobiales bacterium]|nr:VCBS repeat-containing protein [Verrucomicrobiales bacterium]